MLSNEMVPGAGDAPAPGAPEHLNDMVVADAIAHAVRGVPGVLDLGQGVFARAATYGPGRHIAGIVLRHPAPGVLAVETHVVLDGTAFVQALAGVSAGPDASPVLLRCTDSIRTAVSQTLAQLGLPAPATVDVTIDDMR